MSELEETYAGRVDFRVVVPEVSEDGTFIYPDTSKVVENHGLEVRDASGNVVSTIEGHSFSRTEIVEAVEAMLGGTGD